MVTRFNPKFRSNIRRGRRFEAEEKAGWGHIAQKHIAFEASTSSGGKGGRIDIKIDENLGYIALVEVKATDWNKLRHHRIRPTAQRHARQVWRYAEDFVDSRGKDVCPAVVYEYEPKDSHIRAEVEQIFNDRMIQVVWRKKKQL
jgi:hypothetical protein